MANNKPPQKKVPFVGNGSIPSGYILGRVDPGVGPVQLLTLQKAQAGGLAPTSLPPSGPAGGDLGGTYPNPSVVALQGRAVSNAAPTDKFVLTWVAANSDWEPKVLPTTGVGFYSSYFNDGTDNYAAIVNSLADPEIIVDGSGVPVYEKITYSSKAVKGITDGSAAAAGFVGEVISASLGAGSGVNLTNTTITDILTITLTPGDWDVTALASFNVWPGFPVGSPANWTDLAGWTSTTSATFPTLPNNGSFFLITGAANTNGNSVVFSTGTQQINVTVNTTVYLTLRADFSAGSITGYGFLRARRMR